ncbi:TAXI family TRAP transporter solute-binding subunit [Hydrogenophaga soli]
MQAQRQRAQRLKARVQSAGLAVWALLWSAGPVLLLVLAAMGAAYWWLNPTPPKRVVLATGPGQSAYDTFGQQYAKALALNGIELVLRPTEGSSDNLALLRSGEVDLAFVQGGSDTLTDDDRDQLVSLGSLFVEPVWVFYRGAVNRFSHLQQLKGQRVNVGTPGSGVPQLFNSLLDANHLAPADYRLSGLTQTPATVAFLQGEVDALVFASAPESPLVQMLLLTPGVRLMNFAQSEAYSRRFAYLKPVVLPQGVVDLAGNRPSRDVRLIAPTTSLVARADTHPAVLQLMAQTAVKLHGGASWFSTAREFPNLTHAELPLAPEAARAQAGGIPFLQRLLPFWLANLVERMWLAMGLILALALPLSRVVPPLYTLRIRSRVFRWYAELRDIEERAAAVPDGSTPDGAANAVLAELDELERKAGRMVVPLAYADELYALRSHIQLVRKRFLHPLPQERTP